MTTMCDGVMIIINILKIPRCWTTHLIKFKIHGQRSAAPDSGHTNIEDKLTLHIYLRDGVLISAVI